MACNCNKAAAQTTATQEPEFTVTYNDGRTEVVRGEHAAKVAVTRAGGGSYTRK